MILRNKIIFLSILIFSIMIFLSCSNDDKKDDVFIDLLDTATPLPTFTPAPTPLPNPTTLPSPTSTLTPTLTPTPTILSPGSNKLRIWGPIDSNLNKGFV